MKPFFIMLLWSTALLFSAEIHLKTSADWNKHLKFTDKETNSDYLNVGYFYKDNHSLSFELAYKTRYDDSKESLIITSGYSMQKLKSDEKAANDLFGNELAVNKLYISLGLGRNFGHNKTEKFWFFYFGPVYNICKGTSSLDGYKYEFSYENSITFMLGTELDFRLNNYLILTTSLTYGFGEIKRGDLKLSDNEQWLFLAEPTGDDSISDSSLKLSLGLAYFYAFGGKK
ncbi:MAG: hypothetical protein PHR06_05915 [Candidatus Cloacimonetes bacterium]|nr:hypothetical protein [Candidatus Cloacimonadota bacterium]